MNYDLVHAIGGIVITLRFHRQLSETQEIMLFGLKACNKTFDKSQALFSPDDEEICDLIVNRR